MLHRHPRALLLLSSPSLWAKLEKRVMSVTQIPPARDGLLPVCTVLLSWSSRKSATSSLRAARRCFARAPWRAWEEAVGPATSILPWSSSWGRRGLRRGGRSKFDGGGQHPFHRIVNSPQAEGPLPAEVGGQSGERIWVAESRALLVPYSHSGLKSAVPLGHRLPL